MPNIIGIDPGGCETLRVSRSYWRLMMANGYAHMKDGSPYMMYLEESTGLTVYGPVTITADETQEGS
jgi:hypothetical protein